jgi:hypothetical protein
MSPQTGHFYEFGSFRLDPSAKILFCEDKPVSLTPKVFETLQVFVEHAGLRGSVSCCMTPAEVRLEDENLPAPDNVVSTRRLSTIDRLSISRMVTLLFVSVETFYYESRREAVTGYLPSILVGHSLHKISHAPDPANQGLRR